MESPQIQNGSAPTNHSDKGKASNLDAATNKQVQYLLNLGKRHGLTQIQLEDRIESELGKKAGSYARSHST